MERSERTRHTERSTEVAGMTWWEHQPISAFCAQDALSLLSVSLSFCLLIIYQKNMFVHDVGALERFARLDAGSSPCAWLLGWHASDGVHVLRVAHFTQLRSGAGILVSCSCVKS